MLSKRYGIGVYLIGLITSAGCLYLLNAGKDASCAINQSECLGAGMFMMIAIAGTVLGTIAGAILLAKRHFQNSTVKH